jgi:hypothetical protein
MLPTYTSLPPSIQQTKRAVLIASPLVGKANKENADGREVRDH